MKKKIIYMFLMFNSTFVFAVSEEQMIAESKQAIKLFAIQLKAQLQQGMKQGGPGNAIKVCNTAAVDIQNQVSEKLGWKISRTSLKLRNSNNLPDEWEKKVLNDFEQRLTSGETIEKLEFSETFNESTPAVFRYMKVIPTQGLCLNCHGDKLTPEVHEKLQKLYPQDQAIGYKVGDIRGAFTITRDIN